MEILADPVKMERLRQAGIKTLENSFHITLGGYEWIRGHSWAEKAVLGQAPLMTGVYHQFHLYDELGMGTRGAHAPARPNP